MSAIGAKMIISNILNRLVTFVRPEAPPARWQPTLTELPRASKAGAYRVGAIPGAWFHLQSDELGVFGAHAGHAVALTQGIDQFRNVEGFVLKADGPLEDSFIVLQFYQAGYIRDADWAELNADTLLQRTRSNMDLANQGWISAGHAPVSIIGWREEPTYDPERNIVWWALEADETGHRSVNAAALKLSRYGFTNVTWSGRADQFTNATHVLTPSLDRYEFEEGYRYMDAEKGDLISDLTVAGLTAMGISKTS